MFGDSPISTVYPCYPMLTHVIPDIHGRNIPPYRTAAVDLLRMGKKGAECLTGAKKLQGNRSWGTIQQVSLVRQCVWVSMYVCMHVCMYIYIYRYICMYVYI